MLDAMRLRRRFADHLAVDDVSLTIPAGALVGFVGPNGAGKTTTLRMIMGITAPDAGEVRFRGRTVGAADRARFGYMPEQRGLYARMRVREHLVYLARLHGLDVRASRSGADRWIDRLGLGPRAEDRIQDLSHGNQQRVQLAAALAHEPDLVLLDEPFAGLDPIGVAVLCEILRELAGSGVGVLFSSHELELVEALCSAVSIIDRGRIVAGGPIDELTSRQRPRLLVELAGVDPGWAFGLSGVEVLEAVGSQVRLLLEPRRDPQGVLAAAIQAGPVVRFELERARLSEIFLDAVTGSVPGRSHGRAAGRPVGSVTGSAAERPVIEVVGR